MAVSYGKLVKGVNQIQEYSDNETLPVDAGTDTPLGTLGEPSMRLVLLSIVIPVDHCRICPVIVASISSCRVFE